MKNILKITVAIAILNIIPVSTWLIMRGMPIQEVRPNIGYVAGWFLNVMLLFAGFIVVTIWLWDFRPTHKNPKGN